MEDFLNSIPVVHKLIKTEPEDQRPKRDVIFAAIRTALERRLADVRATDGAEGQTRG
jgi:hypothetical protein